MSPMFPERQRTVALPAAVIVAATAVLTAVIIVLWNVAIDFQGAEHPLGTYKFIDNEAAVALIVSATAGLVAIRQAYINFRPLLTYRCDGRIGSAFSKSDIEFWNVEIHNSGGGPAIVKNVTYRIIRLDGSTFETDNSLDIVSELTETGMEEGIDFQNFRISKGENIKANGVFPLIIVNRRKIVKSHRALDVLLTYESLTGGAFYREVWCLPRRWFV